MCGIAGILTSKTEMDLGPSLVRMRDALAHRGPDDHGVAEVAIPGGFRLGLAQTRLAILDVSAAGHQPMCDPASQSWIAYNGEAYNHRELRAGLRDVAFQSQTDTETILKAWVARGERTLDSLGGMFAFGLLDQPRRQFWLVRDRLGIKPLYVARVDSHTWAFASEVRALVASRLVPRVIDGWALSSFLALGAVPAPWSLINGIRSLLPGERWCFELKDSSQPLVPERRRYWKPSFPNCTAVAPTREAVLPELRQRLLEATKQQMLSDVPVGVFLSGGVDSTAVVAALAHQGERLRTFSVGFHEQQYDESPHARAIARHFGTEHAELILEPHSVLRDFEQALSAYDQPSIDGLNTYFISREVRQAGVTVALSGLGGDELFAGYPYFRQLQQLDRPLIRWGARLVHQCLRRLARGQVRTTKLGNALAARRNRLAGWLACREVSLPQQRQELLGQSSSLGTNLLPSEVRQYLEAETANLDAVNAQSICEMSLYMADMLLRDTDQMSMAHALEVRVPLLDHRFVVAVATLPGSLKTMSGADSPVKQLLIDALPERLPPGLLNRPKRGFVLPWERWLRQELRSFVADSLLDNAAVVDAGLSPQGVSAVWERFLARRPGVRSSDILGLLSYVSWVRRHGLSASHQVTASSQQRAAMVQI